MRFEATLNDTRGQLLLDLAAELGLTRSQLMDEALGLFLKAALEVKRGQRLVLVTPDTQKVTCELTSPTLAQLEWASHRDAAWASRVQEVTLPIQAVEKIADLIESAPAPTDVLKRAVAAHRRRHAR